ncbi:MAG: methyltransferase [Bacteroidales bacterium]|nr:methyltransferase [Bacteroidales bacterium]
MEFQCKEYSLNHSQSTMKVGTDSIMLSSLLYYSFLKYDTLLITTPKNILDIGTGCGIIALCSAQTFPSANITAIDIDKLSIEECKENFSLSKWNDRLSAINISLEDFSKQTNEKFDLIVSNPPYFTQSLLSTNERKMLARHNHSLSLENFVLSCMQIISKQSVIAVILPEKESMELEKLFALQNIFLTFSYNIFSRTTNTQPIRRVTLFSSQKDTTLQENIYIRNEDNQYTTNYKNLVSPFLL